MQFKKFRNAAIPPVYAAASMLYKFAARYRLGPLKSAANRPMTFVERHTERDLHCRYFGRKFWFPSDSFIGRQIARGGIWDQSLVNILARIVSHPSLIVEVGSNIGASSVLLRHQYPDARYVLIEASQRFHRYLQRNMPPDINVEILRKTMGRSCGEKVELRTNSTTGSPSLPQYGGDTRTIEMVETGTLDEVLRGLSAIALVDILKIDTDGFECEVLAGAMELIGKSMPVIHVEYSPKSIARMKITPDTLIHMLRDQCGCREFIAIYESGVIKGVFESAEEINHILETDRQYYCDLVALPSSSKYATQFHNTCEQIRRGAATS
jgi:FkbM family methyltransferase